MKLELVTNCYAVKYPQYATYLLAKIASLAAYTSTRHKVKLSIYRVAEDTAVDKVLAIFDDPKTLKQLELNVCVTSLSEISCRAKCRDMAIRDSDADLLWFVDCDHWYKPELLEAICVRSWAPDEVMIYPAVTKISETHSIGDSQSAALQALIDARVIPSLATLENCGAYIAKTYNRAIGGIQLVRGDIARKYGYLPGTRYHVPVETPFSGTTKEDIAYRISLSKIGKITGVTIPGLFRIRQTISGYPVSTQRTKERYLT